MNNLHKIITKDGSFSLRSEKYNENFHSTLGAYQETKDKFINPARLDRFKDKSLTVLDICFGLGYNTSLLFNILINQSTIVKWYGLEIDKRPLQYALNEKKFIELWDPKVIEILKSLHLKSAYRSKQFNCSLLLGDARQKIFNIPEKIKFDLIFLDGFSPQKCPEIWTIEFLSNLKKKMKDTGHLITYSSAASVRRSLQYLGLKIFNIKPYSYNKNHWSNGTLATLDNHKNNPYIIELSIMENEHLQTKASIPYRDPRGNLFSEEILDIRKKEQLFSKLLDTNLWRKKWEMA